MVQLMDQGFMDKWNHMNNPLRANWIQLGGQRCIHGLWHAEPWRQSLMRFCKRSLRRINQCLSQLRLLRLLLCSSCFSVIWFHDSRIVRLLSCVLQRSGKGRGSHWKSDCSDDHLVLRNVPRFTGADSTVEAVGVGWSSQGSRPGSSQRSSPGADGRARSSGTQGVGHFLPMNSMKFYGSEHRKRACFTLDILVQQQIRASAFNWWWLKDVSFSMGWSPTTQWLDAGGVKLPPSNEGMGAAGSGNACKMGLKSHPSTTSRRTTWYRHPLCTTGIFVLMPQIHSHF